MRLSPEQAKRLALTAASLTDSLYQPSEASHPFEQRKIGEVFPSKVKELFDDGHYADASFTALKYLDKYVQKHSGSTEIGKSLMMGVFNCDKSSPLITMGDLTTDTGRNQQTGFRFLCAGAVLFVRNPRGHEVEMSDSADDCLDYLSIVAVLIREMVKAGYR